MVLLIGTAIEFSGAVLAKAAERQMTRRASSVKRYYEQARNDVLSCLQQNMSRISKGYRQVLVKYGQ